MFRTTRIFPHILLFLTIAFLAFLVFKPTFLLAHSGDDWLAFYRYKKHLGDWSSGQFNHLTYFLTPYGAQDILMGTLQKVFGYSSQLYYSTSFFLRLFAALVIYLFVSLLTKSKIAGFISGLFFAVAVVGADATNWVFNMPSYLGIASLVPAFYFFLKSQRESQGRYLLPSALFFYLAIVVAPIRMHGIPFIVLALDLFWFLQRRSVSIFKKIIMRQLLIAGVFLFVRVSGQSLGLTPTDKLSEGINFISFAIKNKDFAFLLHPFVIAGRFFIPEEAWQLTNKLPISSYLLRVFASVFAVFLPLLILLRGVEEKVNKKIKTFPLVVLLLLVWALVVRGVLKNNPLYLDPSFTGPAILGGLFVVSSLAIIGTVFNQRISNILFLGLAWTFLSFAYPWLWTPNATFGTTHRYFIVSSLGIAIFWGVLVALSYKTRYKLLVIASALMFILIQSLSANSYFLHLVDVRGIDKFNKAWGSIPHIEEVTTDPPIIFYFEGNSALAYHLITFGFPAHMGVKYNFEKENRLPIPMSDWNEVVSAVTTGAPLTAYGHEPNPVPLEKVYFFRVTDDAEVLNISEQKRKELREIIKRS